MRWTRKGDGYRCGRVELHDNGGGRGPARGSGRWALMLDGRWTANVDTLVEGKRRGMELAEAAAVPATVILKGRTG